MTKVRTAPNIRVTHIQFMQLVEWLRQPDILKGVKHYADVGERAAKALGFPISTHTVVDALSAAKVKMPDDSYAASRQKAKPLSAEEATALRKELEETKLLAQHAMDLAVAVSQAFTLEFARLPGGNPHKMPPGQANELKARMIDIGNMLLDVEALPASLKAGVFRGNSAAQP